MAAHSPLTNNQGSNESTHAVRLEAIGVIGAGVMGVGVVHALAQNGLQTLLIDVSDSRRKSGRGFYSYED